MSRASVKEWVKDRFVDSATAVPATYPQSAICGILNAAGFPQDKVTILTARPSGNIDAAQGAIIITISEEDEVQKTGNGAYGTIINTVSVEIYLMWVALKENYPTEEAADLEWEQFVNAAKRTARLINYVKRDAGAPLEASNWKLIDANTSQISYISGRQPTLKTIVGDSQPAEDNSAILYGAVLLCEFVETYSGI